MLDSRSTEPKISIAPLERRTCVSNEHQNLLNRHRRQLRRAIEALRAAENVLMSTRRELKAMLDAEPPAAPAAPLSNGKPDDDDFDFNPPDVPRKDRT
jgi:ABC-type transporter Mla subunit MlaD